MTNRHNQDSEETVNFFKEGVKQGIFRDDVNFAIINMLVREQDQRVDEYGHLQRVFLP